MLARVLRAVLPATLLLALGMPLAHAEIYTWIDASGVTNVSNLPPPDGVKVTKVQRALPPDIVAREDAARDAARQSEALAARVRQLEEEAMARSMPPPDFRPVMAPPPPVIQYIVQAPPPAMQQTVEVTQAPYGGYGYGGYGYGGYGCDPSWAGCALSWFPGFYPASVIVVPTNNFRHAHPVRGNGNNNVVQPRLPPPFGPPLVPNLGPPFSPKLVGQQSMRSPLSSGLRRS